MPQPRPRRSALDLLDTWLLAAMAIVAAVVVLKVLGWVLGTVVFVLKVAVLALAVAVAVHLASRRRSRSS